MVEHGTKEGGELGIAAAGAGDGIDGRLRVGMRAARVGELGVIAGTIFREECAGFVKGVVVGNAAGLAMETFLGKECFLLRGEVFGREVSGASCRR